jgi:hypothetical protein
MSKRKHDASVPADANESVPPPQRSKLANSAEFADEPTASNTVVILPKRHYTTGNAINDAESKHVWTDGGLKCDHQCALLPKKSFVPLRVLEDVQETPFSGDTNKTIVSVQCVTADGVRTEMRLTITNEEHMTTAKVCVHASF